MLPYYMTIHNIDRILHSDSAFTRADYQNNRASNASGGGFKNLEKK